MTPTIGSQRRHEDGKARMEEEGGRNGPVQPPQGLAVGDDMTLLSGGRRGEGTTVGQGGRCRRSDGRPRVWHRGAALSPGNFLPNDAEVIKA